MKFTIRRAAGTEQYWKPNGLRGTRRVPGYAVHMQRPNGQRPLHMGNYHTRERAEQAAQTYTELFAA